MNYYLTLINEDSTYSPTEMHTILEKYKFSDYLYVYDPCKNCVNKGKVCSCALPSMYNPIYEVVCK